MIANRRQRLAGPRSAGGGRVEPVEAGPKSRCAPGRSGSTGPAARCAGRRSAPRNRCGRACPRATAPAPRPVPPPRHGRRERASASVISPGVTARTSRICTCPTAVRRVPPLLTDGRFQRRNAQVMAPLSRPASSRWVRITAGPAPSPDQSVDPGPHRAAFFFRARSSIASLRNLTTPATRLSGSGSSSGKRSVALPERYRFAAALKAASPVGAG